MEQQPTTNNIVQKIWGGRAISLFLCLTIINLTNISYLWAIPGVIILVLLSDRFILWNEHRLFKKQLQKQFAKNFQEIIEDHLRQIIENGDHESDGIYMIDEDGKPKKLEEDSEEYQKAQQLLDTKYPKKDDDEEATE